LISLVEALTPAQIVSPARISVIGLREPIVAEGAVWTASAGKRPA
jgi:hypothetical protein